MMKLTARNGTQYSSAQVVASIDDLLREIFQRLPLKFRFQFKLVSKHWYSVISDPLLRDPNPNPAIGLILRLSKVRYICLPFFIDEKSTNNSRLFRQLEFPSELLDIKIIQSCNGLLLLSSFGTTPDCEYDHSRQTYHVYNPTTKKLSTLPKLDLGLLSTQQGMSLIFDPTKSPHYKVLVCVLEMRLDSAGYDIYQYQLKVYSPETGWLQCRQPFLAHVEFENGVYWKGAIHWIGFSPSDDSFYFNPDLHQTPQIMQTPLSQNGGEWRLNYYFGESCEHLNYVEVFEPRFLGLVNVYELKRDYSEWFVKYQVDLLPIVSDWNNCNKFAVLTVVRGEKEEDSFLVLKVVDKIIRYDFGCRSFETVYDFEGAEVEAGCVRFQSTNGFQFIESCSCV